MSAKTGGLKRKVIDVDESDDTSSQARERRIIIPQVEPGSDLEAEVFGLLIERNPEFIGELGMRLSASEIVALANSYRKGEKWALVERLSSNAVWQYIFFKKFVQVADTLTEQEISAMADSPYWTLLLQAVDAFLRPRREKPSIQTGGLRVKDIQQTYSRGTRRTISLVPGVQQVRRDLATAYKAWYEYKIRVLQNMRSLQFNPVEKAFVIPERFNGIGFRSLYWINDLFFAQVFYAEGVVRVISLDANAMKGTRIEIKIPVATLNAESFDFPISVHLFKNRIFVYILDEETDNTSLVIHTISPLVSGGAVTTQQAQLLGTTRGNFERHAFMDNGIFHHEAFIPGGKGYTSVLYNLNEERIEDIIDTAYAFESHTNVDFFGASLKNVTPYYDINRGRYYSYELVKFNGSMRPGETLTEFVDRNTFKYEARQSMDLPRNIQRVHETDQAMVYLGVRDGDRAIVISKDSRMDVRNYRRTNRVVDISLSEYDYNRYHSNDHYLVFLDKTTIVDEDADNDDDEDDNGREVVRLSFYHWDTVLQNREINRDRADATYSFVDFKPSDAFADENWSEFRVSQMIGEDKNVVFVEIQIRDYSKNDSDGSTPYKRALLFKATLNSADPERSEIEIISVSRKPRAHKFTKTTLAQKDELISRVSTMRPEFAKAKLVHFTNHYVLAYYGDKEALRLFDYNGGLELSSAKYAGGDKL